MKDIGYYFSFIPYTRNTCMNQTKYEKAIVDLLTDMETFLVINGLSLTQFNEWRKIKEKGFYDVCED